MSSTSSNPYFCCTSSNSHCHRLTIAVTATPTSGSTIELTLPSTLPKNQIVKINIFAVSPPEFFEAYHAKVTPCDGAYLEWASPDKRDDFKVFETVQRPTLVLQSRSDFIVAHEARQVWERAAAAHESMITCLCSGGGHATRSEGWCGSSLWMGRACHEFFESVIKMNSQSANSK